MLINSFNLDVFHLMGGSPALYIDHWPELIDRLGPDVVFHSDFCLTERTYHPNFLTKIARPNCLYAVNVKGVTSEDYMKNTGCKIDWELWWHNLDMLFLSRVPFYLTFTNPDRSHLDAFCKEIADFYFGPRILEDMVVIDVIDYDAVKAYNSKGVKHDQCLQV
jgi:uncharacterized Fe-S cluster-containing radical SAM superfamily protein